MRIWHGGSFFTSLLGSETARQLDPHIHGKSQFILRHQSFHLSVHCYSPSVTLSATNSPSVATREQTICILLIIAFPVHSLFLYLNFVEINGVWFFSAIFVLLVWSQRRTYSATSARHYSA